MSMDMSSASLPLDPASLQLVNPSWATCNHCGSGDYYEGDDIAPRTIIICSSCINCCHVECHQKACGTDDDSFARESDWFCSKGCQHVYESMNKAIGAKIECQEKQISIEWSRFTSSEQKAANQSIDAAYALFRTSFGKIELEDGRDLIKLVTYSHVDPDEYDDAVDFSSFFVVALRKGPIIVSAAVLRVRGQIFAELPFITTRKNSRGEGHCRRLVSAVEKRLISLGVKHLVIPSLESAMGMWTTKFGYQRLSEKELEDLGSSILQMDPESSIFLKKRLDKPIAEESQRVAAVSGKRVRAKVASSSEPDEDQGSDSEVNEKDKVKKRPRVNTPIVKNFSSKPVDSARSHFQGRGGGGSKGSCPKPHPKHAGVSRIAAAGNLKPRRSAPASLMNKRPGTCISFLKSSKPPLHDFITASSLCLLIKEWLVGSHQLDNEISCSDDPGSIDLSSPCVLITPPSPQSITLDKSKFLWRSGGSKGAEREIDLGLPLKSPTKHLKTIKLTPSKKRLSLPMERFQSEVMDALLPSVVHCLFATPTPAAAAPAAGQDPRPFKDTPKTSPSSAEALEEHALPLSNLQLQIETSAAEGGEKMAEGDESIVIGVEESLAIAAQYAYSLDDDQA